MLKEVADTTQESSRNVRDLFNLSGRVAIVTGGSIGLGRQIAEGLAEMGANLVLCARKDASTRSPVAESRAPVGSSANGTLRWPTRARAMATCCCWPPDSSSGNKAA